MLKRISLFISILFLTTYCFGGSLHKKANTLQEQTAEITEHYVTAPDGVKIHYVTLGTGVPVLLIHGHYANLKNNWFDNGIAQELAKTNMVIAIDNRGHGKSDKPHTRTAYGDKMWKDSIIVLDELNIQKAHIHGYSMGGTILTQILFHYPERVLTATYGGAGVPEYDKEFREKIPADEKATQQVRDEEKQAQQMVQNDLDDFIAPYLVGKNGPWDGKEHKDIDLTQITIPVLGLNGQYDSPNARTARMKRQLPNFRSIVLKDKAHLTAITKGFMPKEYLDTSVQFIRDYDSKNSN